MTSNSEIGNISFDLPKNQSNVIKVIGVGGGGSNAINHMFKQGIKGVDFIVCNTDSQALQNSPVPNKIQLGVNLTEGLGAGANPDVGQQSAIESIGDIEKMLDANTKMVFITAGMGGGTGTGAAPVIAQLAKERDILTVGIVTIPFQFEGKVRSEQALLGVEKLRKQVDSLIVINNNKLREVYGNLGFKAGFSKADEVLATASRGIAEVITHHYTQNIDLKDAKTVLENSGRAIMGSATASGDNRAKEAIISALDSPLLNDNKISGAKNVLLLIVSGNNEITIDEIGEINDHIQSEAGHNANIIMGVGEDETLGDSIAVTIIATGFNEEQQNGILNLEEKKIIHSLDGEHKIERDLTQKPVAVFQTIIDTPAKEIKEEKIFFELIEDEFDSSKIEMVQQASVVSSIDEKELIAMNHFIRNLDVTFEIVSPINDIDFKVTTPEVREMKVVESQAIVDESLKQVQVEEEQITFTFDMPAMPTFERVEEVNSVKAVEENRIIFDLSDSPNDIEVNQPLQFIPVTELNEGGMIKYSLEEYMELENDLLNSKPAAAIVVEEPVADELKITMKRVDVQKPTSTVSHFEDISPVEMTIEETLKHRADDRRKKLKEFNYKFHNNPSKIDELEKEPAYKRNGVDLSTNIPADTKSRMSIGIDSNDDTQLRSNNSFLHDNVD
ncbi:cell division protein FtsZ [Flavobacterium sp.]|uniref:cell division protein FtsZ n=1 Tax=Flavobacterium sp. TaxID=239 RepID=UPI0025F4479C|nr:cell division protein FtsZ [Flavobacterium sp.]